MPERNFEKAKQENNNNNTRKFWKNLMCSARFFLKIFDSFAFFRPLENIDVFCRKISENFDPSSHFQASW